jgi:hypothetical protein
MADALRALTPLQIPTLALCRRVDGYGAYEPLPPRLPAQREKGVVLYCEIEGFFSRLGDRRLWETRLSQEVWLYDGQGQAVWHDSSITVDVSRHRRRDFFIARIIHFPGTLAEGQYTLKVALTDSLSGKVAEAALPLQVAGEE